MLAAKLLFQLPHEPHLNLLEGLQLGHRNKDDDGFPAATNLDFLNARIQFEVTSHAKLLSQNKLSISPKTILGESDVLCMV